MPPSVFPSRFAASMRAIISRLGVGVERAQRRRVGRGVEVRRHLSRTRRIDAAEVHEVAADAYAELARGSVLQIAPAATRAVVSRADARSRMSRASSRSYLSMPVRSAWPGRTRVTARLRGVGIALARRGIHDLLPVLPVAIVDQHRDRRAERLAGAHAGEELSVVLLDLHAPPAAVALLAARELDVDVLGEEWQARGHSFENGHERVPVGFAGGCEAQHASPRKRNEPGF